MKDNKVLYGIIIILSAAFIWLFIKFNQAQKEVSDLEFSLKTLMDGRAEELRIEKEIAEVKVKEIQIKIDSLYKADSLDELKHNKTIKWYEKRIKEFKVVNTVIGIDHIRDSILRANGVKR